MVKSFLNKLKDRGSIPGTHCHVAWWLVPPSAGVQAEAGRIPRAHSLTHTHRGICTYTIGGWHSKRCLKLFPGLHIPMHMHPKSCKHIQTCIAHTKILY